MPLKFHIKNRYCYSFLLLLTLLYILPADAQQRQSVYGGAFTPIGDIRFLVIFASLEKDYDQNANDFNHSEWPEVNPRQNRAAGKTILQHYDQLFYQDFEQFSPDNTDRSISNFYYQMSRKHPDKAPLRIVADIFPERIVVKESRQNNKAVFRQIASLYPDFDWSRYDLRNNHPNFGFDNSQTGPDGNIDFVIVVWRKEGCRGYASINDDHTFDTPKGIYKIQRQDGFTIENSMWHMPGLKGLFIHEMAHSLYNCPHYFTTNGVLGSYFYSTSGWGMCAYDQVNTSANAWESWYTGWIELKPENDIREPRNCRLTLDDFVSTGDAIRIHIPGTNQRLWLENHSGATIFDNRESWQTDGIGDSTPMPSKGLYMYIERITDSRDEIISALGHQYSNGLRTISASGNFDYEVLGEELSIQVFNNIAADFRKLRPNPAGPHSDMATIRANYQYDTLYPEAIFTRNFTNNSRQNVPLCGKYPPHSVSNEYRMLFREEGVYTYAGLGLDFAFRQPGQKAGLSCNPLITPLQYYDECTETLESMILTGLSVELISIDSLSNRITIDIRFDDTEIINNQRLTGNLLIPRNAAAESDLVIGEDMKLTVDKSGSPNRRTRGELLNGHYANPDFVNISRLTFDTLSRIHLKKKATLRIREGSELIIGPGTQLRLDHKARIIIEKGSRLFIAEPFVPEIARSARIRYKQSNKKLQRTD